MRKQSTLATSLRKYRSIVQTKPYLHDYHNKEHYMFTSWKRTIAIVCLALFLATTAASFMPAVSQAACVPSATVGCGGPKRYN